MSDSEREDRLSSLPDDILVEILSLLPIKSAANTRKLSHRWTNLWTHIKSVIISEADFESLYLDTFTDDIFPRLASPMFDKIVLSFKGIYNDVTFCLRGGKRFVGLLSDLNVREIHLLFQIFCYCPPSIFRTNSLVALHLDSIKLVDDDIECIDLPKLRKLSMRLELVTKSCCKVLEKIVRSCPSLEDLYMDFLFGFEKVLRKPLVFRLSSQNLRVLNINEDLECSYAHFFTVVVEAPDLESFRFYTTSGIHCCFTEVSATLLEADISLDTYDDYSTTSLDYDDYSPASLHDGDEVSSSSDDNSTTSVSNSDDDSVTALVDDDDGVSSNNDDEDSTTSLDDDDDVSSNNDDEDSTTSLDDDDDEDDDVSWNSDECSTTSVDDDYDVTEKMVTAKLELYGSISNVRTLTLDSTQLINTSTVFPNLTSLTLTYPRPDTWQSAIDLLVQCPFLINLVLRANRPDDYDDDDEPWSPAKIIPACMTTHVKRIEIEIEVGKRFEYRVELSWLKLVRFLLSCATVLERLDISVIGDEYVREIVQESDQVSLFKELHGCPRISLCCQVEIYGILKFEGRKERVWEVSDGMISLLYD